MKKEEEELGKVLFKSKFYLDYDNCVKSDDILKPFSILRKCTSDYNPKIMQNY